jgi:putative membrane protein
MGAHLKYLASAVVSSLIAIAGIAVAAEIGRTADEREFINKAAQRGHMEVLAGKLVLQRALDPAVKDFGQRMASDPTAANAQLKKLADSK